MTQTRLHRIGLAALALVSLAALAYLAPKAFLDTRPAIDFTYIWLAGDLWSQGINPYSDTFQEVGRQMFVDPNRPEHFFYPPPWWPISVGFAQMDYDTAKSVYRIALLALLAGSVAVLAWPLARLLRAGPFALAGFVLFLGLGSAAAIAISIGQTSIFMLIGVLAFCLAYLAPHRLLMAAALAILVLKPNIGLLFIALLLPQLRWWPSLFLGGALSLAMSAMALMTPDLLTVLASYRTELAFFEIYPLNGPATTTGLANLADAGFGFRLLPIPLVLGGAVLCLGLGLLRQLRPALDVRDLARDLVLMIGLTVLVVQLHIYDLVILAPLAVLAPALAPPLRWLTVAGMVLAFRPNNIGDAVGGMVAGGFLIASVGCVLVLAAALLAHFAPGRGA